MQKIQINEEYDQCSVCLNAESHPTRTRMRCRIYDYFTYRDRQCPNFKLRQQTIAYIRELRVTGKIPDFPPR